LRDFSVLGAALARRKEIWSLAPRGNEGDPVILGGQGKPKIPQSLIFKINEKSLQREKKRTEAQGFLVTFWPAKKVTG